MLSFLLIIFSLFLYGFDANIFKSASNDELSIYDSIIYYPIHSILYIIIGLPFLQVDILSIILDVNFLILSITEVLSSLGILLVLRDTNATVSVAILGIANMSAALFVDFSVWIFVIINIICLGFYLYQSRNNLSIKGWIASLVLIFLPSVISATLLTTFTDSAGNAMAVFGFATLIPSILAFIIFVKKIRFRKTKPFVRSAAISGVAGLICYYAFSITTSPAVSLMALSFEAIMTEISAYMFKDQTNLSLGNKSKIQFLSLVIMSASIVISTVIHS